MRRETPIVLQFLLMQRNPCLHKLVLLYWQTAAQHLPFERVYRLLVGILRMNVRKRIRAPNLYIHGNDNPVETAEFGHNYPLPCGAAPHSRDEEDLANVVWAEGGTLRLLGHGMKPSVRTGSLHLL